MLKYHYKRILLITLTWVIISQWITLYDHMLFLSHLSEGTTEEYSLFKSIIGNLFAGFVGGVFGSVVLITLNRKFKKRPYYQSLIVVVVAFVLIINLVTNLLGVIETYVAMGTMRGPEAMDYYRSRIFTTFHVKNILFWAVVVIITHITIQVSDKFGPGNLWKIITGQYHTPREESRIFMFLDLKSSTTIAEQLGDKKYHEFLSDTFSDITDSIVKNKAEIYQYVGDEVILCWELDENTDANCLNCFVDIQNMFESKKTYYKMKYNTVPVFKAGAHFGKVIVGEVGDLKREITYSGDVLNTTARIQGQCNDLASLFLISGKLKDHLNSQENNWLFASKGFIPLKGKEHDLELFSVVKS